MYTHACPRTHPLLLSGGQKLPMKGRWKAGDVDTCRAQEFSWVSSQKPAQRTIYSLTFSLSLSLCLSVNDSALTNRACLDAIMAIKINPMINPPHTNRSLVRGGGEAEMQLLQWWVTSQEDCICGKCKRSLLHDLWCNHSHSSRSRRLTPNLRNRGRTRIKYWATVQIAWTPAVAN